MEWSDSDFHWIFWHNLQILVRSISQAGAMLCKIADRKHSSLALGSFMQISTYPDAVLLAFRLFLLLNIVAALYPLYQTKDDISDIPLTPSQRSLLGLDPNRTPPATPGTQYVTPPRYRLSSGSRKAGSVSPNGSPLSGRGISPSGRRPSDSSPFSPSPSPLLQKTFPIGSRDTGRRHSFGSPSPLGRSSISIRDGSVLRTPSSPNASFGKGSGQVLTNKWLYEKNRMMSSSSSSVFSQ